MGSTIINLEGAAESKVFSYSSKPQPPSLPERSSAWELARVLVRELDGKVIYWAHGAQRLYGWTKKQALGRNVQELLKTEWAIPFAEFASAILNDGEWEGEVLQTRRDGTKLPVSIYCALQTDEQGAPVAIIEEHHDLTRLKQAESILRESEQKLRDLSAYLQAKHEDECRRLAYEVREDFAQRLAGLKYELSRLDKKLIQTNVVQSRELLDQTRSITELVNDTISAVQRIATGLRPDLLDHCGLVAAIEWKAKDFQQSTRINCAVKSSGNLTGIPQEISTTIFRIFECLLDNFHNEGYATHIEINLQRINHELLLDLTGRCAMVAKKAPQCLTRLLHTDICERAHGLGGQVAINHDCNGCQVSIKVPLPLSQ